MIDRSASELESAKLPRRRSARESSCSMGTAKASAQTCNCGGGRNRRVARLIWRGQQRRKPGAQIARAGHLAAAHARLAERDYVGVALRSPIDDRGQLPGRVLTRDVLVGGRRSRPDGRCCDRDPLSAATTGPTLRFMWPCASLTAKHPMSRLPGRCRGVVSTVCLYGGEGSGAPIRGDGSSPAAATPSAPTVDLLASDPVANTRPSPVRVAR
jgi:hypothetical protein